MKSVFIIAGFDIHNTAASDKYSTLKNALKSKGYKTLPVNISWRHKTTLQYAQEFKSYYLKHKTEDNIVLGNSFGAVVAFLSASAIKPDFIILGSLSPFFKEDRGKRPDSYGLKYFGKRRMEELWGISAKDIAQDINHTHIKTIVAYGQLELESSPLLVERCRQLSKEIKGAKLIELPKSPHTMADARYSLEIAKLI